MENAGFSPVLHEQIHQVVEQQIKENNPKETKETLDRLMRLGYNRHDAIHKIGTVVVEELFETLKTKQKFDEKRFLDRLHRLE